jgi:putative nucleotidyltransferase with HDIG domain
MRRPNAARTKFRGKVRPNPLDGVRRFLRESEWFWALVFFSVVGSLFARQFHLQPPPSLALNSIATRDIRAPFDLEIQDEGATQAKRNEAVQRVPPLYDWDSARADAAMAQVSSFFSESLRRSKELQTWLKQAKPDATARRDAEEMFFKRLSETAGGGISRFGLKEFYREGFSPQLEQGVDEVLKEILSRKVVVTDERFQGRDVVRVRDIRKSAAEWEQRDPASGDILTVDQARELVGPLVESRLGFSPLTRAAVEEYVRGMVTPTLTFNSQETVRRQDAASAQVEPLVIPVRKDQPLATAGVKVDEKVLLKISAFQQASKTLVNLSLVSALLGFLLLLLLFSFMYLKSYRKEHVPNLNLFVIFLQLAAGYALLNQAFLFVLEALAEDNPSPLLGTPQYHVYILPVAAGAMLVTLLVDRNIAVVFALFWSVLFGMLTGMSFPMTLYALLASCAGIFAAVKFGQKKAPRKAALVMGVVQIVLAGGVLAAGPQWEAPFQGAQTWIFLAFLGGGLLTPLAVFPLVQPYEQAYGLLTELRLTGLANTNHPLLRRLSVEAPGTYGHAMMLATMTEAAANSIGANGLFCRVGSYFHDVGKLFNPMMFVENQVQDQNPHDRLPPVSSAKIVAAHVKEGIAIAREAGLPGAIIDLIPQHHGDRRISYFYEKALTMVDPEKEGLKDEDFRYPGPRPKSREAAILMLADGVEAGSRLLREPTELQLRKLIREICDRVVSEGQLVECDLTYEDMSQIQETFLKILQGVFAKRISYPSYSFDKEGADG